ncbi:MAG: mechanosensitive ion channel domain-containing protein [Candidatus Thorarchaeota archaeon]|jgi:small conductance mechanosensitive channel
MQAPDFFVDPIGFIAFFLGEAGPLVFLAAQLIVLLFLYVILTRLIRGSLHAAGMGLEASTGIILAVRLIFFVSALFVVVGYVGPGTATLLSLTAVFGTALGLAFSQAMSNIVSGLYVLAARPFRVGDYVKIGSVQGVVKEITLNYTQILLPDMTRQLVPNSRAVSSEVTITESSCRKSSMSPNKKRMMTTQCGTR